MKKSKRNMAVPCKGCGKMPEYDHDLAIKSVYADDVTTWTVYCGNYKCENWFSATSKSKAEAKSAWNYVNRQGETNGQPSSK